MSTKRSRATLFVRRYFTHGNSIATAYMRRVPPRGVEPRFQDPESCVLSIKLWGPSGCLFCTMPYEAKEDHVRTGQWRQIAHLSGRKEQTAKVSVRTFCKIRDSSTLLLQRACCCTLSGFCFIGSCNKFSSRARRCESAGLAFPITEYPPAHSLEHYVIVVGFYRC